MIRFLKNLQEFRAFVSKKLEYNPELSFMEWNMVNHNINMFCPIPPQAPYNLVLIFTLYKQISYSFQNLWGFKLKKKNVRGDPYQKIFYFIFLNINRFLSLRGIEWYPFG